MDNNERADFLKKLQDVTTEDVKLEGPDSDRERKGWADENAYGGFKPKTKEEER